MARPVRSLSAPPLRSAIASSWALFLGIGLMMAGNGLSGTLVGIRSTVEGFDTLAIGVLTAGYYAGFLLGSWLALIALRRVGHVRVFAALASVASMAALVHPLFVDAVFWTFFRFITGLCMAGLYVVAESWLNDGATNSNRGAMMSGYLVVGLGGKVLGQALLNVAPPEGFKLFVVASLLVSAALVPISLSARALPPLSQPASVGFVELLRAAPTGLATVFVSGISTAALTGLLAVQATQNGLSTARVSALVGALLVGGVSFQIPVGALSDRIERRKVILGASVAVALVAAGLGEVELSWFVFLAAIFLLGGVVFPLYGLGVALTNDWVRSEQRAGASVVIMVVSGSGAILGPLLGSFAITQNSSGLFWLVAVVNGAYALYLAVRIVIREPVAVGDQVRYRPILERASGAVRHLTGKGRVVR